MSTKSPHPEKGMVFRNINVREVLPSHLNVMETDGILIFRSKLSNHG